MRQLLLSVVALVSVALPAVAGEAKPNTLTPKEVADGWILLFDGKTTFGWKIDGNIVTHDGELVVSPKTAATTTTQFNRFEMLFDYQIGGKGNARVEHVVAGTNLGKAEAGAWGQGYVVLDHNPIIRTIVRQTDGVSVAIELKMEQLLTVPITSIKFITDSDTKLHLRNIKLKPLGTRPLFNGKDLAGWHVFPGKKSKFPVEDGAIRVQDGPGDLQTEGKYGDFVLQLECKSNGKHLNSGVFFRCRAGEYQNGYEAQIRNQFTPEPTQEYTIEKYDPETHQLVGKEKVKATAVDYGTGAIYRRVPARGEASKDGEWFTLTVVARGNHFATWVNGVQQTDWTDNRPPSDNARTGYRRDPGHLSIQGHDPTTDLSFRNLRIAELPAAK